MTKKDYVLIAGVLKINKPVNLNQQCIFENILNDLISRLEDENSLFDREKFLTFIGKYEL